MVISFYLLYISICCFISFYQYLRSREHEEQQHEHEQRRWSEHAERGQVAVAAAREAAAAALDAHRLFTERVQG